MVLLLVLLLLAPPDPPSLQSAAEHALAARFPEAAERLRVRVLRTGGDMSTAAVGTTSLRIELGSDEALPRGHTKADVLLQTPTGWQKTGWALLHVAHFDSVVVARRFVRRGEAVSPSDLGAAWIETTAFHGEPLRTADLRALGTDRFAGRALRPDHALRQGDLRPPFAADTGDTVAMRYERGPLSFTIPCHARRPGTVGDVVRLYAPATGTTYRARLTGPGEAEWIATL